MGGTTLCRCPHFLHASGLWSVLHGLGLLPAPFDLSSHGERSAHCRREAGRAARCLAPRSGRAAASDPEPALGLSAGAGVSHHHHCAAALPPDPGVSARRWGPLLLVYRLLFLCTQKPRGGREGAKAEI